MRRLLLILALAAATLTTASSAGAEAVPTTKIADGAARKAGAFAEGWFVVRNTGTRTTLRTGGHVAVDDGRLHLAILRWTTAPLLPGDRRRVHFRASLPRRLHPGDWRIDGCTHGRCLRIGRFWIVAGASAGASPGSGGASTKPGTKASNPSAPTAPATGSCLPSPGPIAYPVGEPFRHVGECGNEYFGFVPSSYRAGTPMPLLIWLHGCGGEAEGDAWVVGPVAEEEPQGWLTLSLGGRDGGCWVPSIDEAKVMAALADFEAHFDVNRRRVILAGYSSGGDLAYRTGFRHSPTFAGLLIENSAPFRDTESTQAESLAAATTKLHIVHLAHEADEIYGLAEVEEEVAAVKAAGFPITLVKRPGRHYDSHTDSDLRTYLLPHIDDGWLAADGA
jgi:hypothetical protein